MITLNPTLSILNFIRTKAARLIDITTDADIIHMYAVDKERNFPYPFPCLSILNYITISIT